MAAKLKQFLRVLWGLGVVAALAFGASTALQAADVCGDDPGEIGTCPPFDDSSCNLECMARFDSGGDCVQGCCICAV